MTTYAAAAGRVKSSIPLGGHLWHVIGAVGFVAISLGGIWLSEVWQRRRKVAGLDGSAPNQWLAGPVGGSALGTAGLVTTARPGARGQVPRRLILLPLVGLGSVAAASVHFVVMPEHFREATIYGSFFAIAATLQVAFAVLVLARPSRPLIAVGLVGNLSVIVLWLVTRTVAIPLGPAAGTTEAIGGLDILATVFESVIVVSSALLLWRRRVSIPPALRPSSWAQPLWVLPVLVGMAVAVTTVVAPPS